MSAGHCVSHPGLSLKPNFLAGLLQAPAGLRGQSGCLPLHSNFCECEALVEFNSK